jgi:hypothetical protein
MCLTISKLETAPYLDSIGLDVNVILELLICRACQISLLESHILAHMADIHTDEHIKVDSDKLKDDCLAMQVSEGLPELGRGPFQEFHGLLVHDCLLCEKCGWIGGGPDSMKNHHWSQHKDSRLPGSWKAIKAQRLNNSSKKNYLWILPRAATEMTGTESIIANLRSQWATSLEKDSGESHDARVLSPWLRTTKWNEHVCSYDQAELLGLVAPLTRDELPGLKSAVASLMQCAMKLIDITPELVLQILNSPDPDKRYV